MQSAPTHLVRKLGDRVPKLLKRHLGKAARLAAVQLPRPLVPQQLHRAHADAQELAHAFAAEGVGHARPLDLAVQRLVAHAQQRAAGHPQAQAAGGDGGAFHALAGPGAAARHGGAAAAVAGAPGALSRAMPRVA
jgi:hypothetical protein